MKGGRNDVWYFRYSNDPYTCFSQFLLVDSKLRGLKFVGFMEEVYQAVGMPVDIFDVSHIKKGSKIDHEINATGVIVYEK